jgi:phosphinothricin acetyltransferase
MASKLEFIIRDATLDDLDQIYFFWHGAVEQAIAMQLDPVKQAQEERYKEAFRQKFEEVDETYRIWVADLDGKIIGWQYLMPFENNPVFRHLTAEVSTYVAPDYRRSGVGTALLEHATMHAWGTSLQFVVGYISADNDAIRRVASRLGFRKAGEFPPPLKDPKGGKSYIYYYMVPAR